MLNTVSENIQKIYLFETEGKSREACIFIVETLFEYKYSENPELILNSFFSLLDFNLLSSWSLIGLLRSTFIFRNKIKVWRDLYDFTYKYLLDNNLNAERELYGLDQL